MSKSTLKILFIAILGAITSFFIILLLPSLVNPDSNLLIKSFLFLNIVGWILSIRYLWQNYLKLWKKKSH